MEAYRDMKIKKKAKLDMIRNLIFFVTLIIFTFWYIFKDQDLNELINTINIANKKYVFIGFISMFCAYLMESINVRNVLISLGEKKISIFRALKYTSIGAFFSAITPGSTGGQPVEVYYMSKDDIKPTNGTLALLIELCSFQICTILLAIICGIFNYSLLKDGIIWFYILGIAVNSVVLTVMLLGMYSNKAAKKLLNLILKILAKSKVKNYEKKKQKLEEASNQYIESAKFIRNNKMVFVRGIFIVFIQVVFYFSIPYFIYRSFGLTELSYLKLFSMQAILYKSAASIPIPGSIGVSETLFMKLYGVAFGKSLLSGAMLLSRFTSFYVYIIIFSIVFLINATKTKNIDSIIDKDVEEIDKDYNLSY